MAIGANMSNGVSHAGLGQSERWRANAELLIGTTVGSWLVVGPVRLAGGTSKQRVLTVRCLCMCGSGVEKYQRCSLIRRGVTKGCTVCCVGRRGRRVGKSQGAAKCPDRIERVVVRQWSSYTREAARAGREFSLTRERFAEPLLGDCSYCGTPAGDLIERGNGVTRGLNGIDRVDNSFGYVAGNCVSCCAPCNRFKAAMPVVRFAETVDRLHAHKAKTGWASAVELLQAA